MKKFIRFLKWFAIHMGAFLLAVWILMGVSPQKACQDISKQFSSYVHGIKSFWYNFSDASVRLGKKANQYGLQEANNVRAGKDYYEGYDLNKNAR